MVGCIRQWSLSCWGLCVVTLVAFVIQIAPLQICHHPPPPPFSIFTSNCLRFRLPIVSADMKCCCSCKGEGWIRCVHFFLTFTILYLQLMNGRSGNVFVYMSLYNAHLVLEMYRCNVLFIDLHNAWVNQSCCYVYLFFVLLFVSSFFYLIASLVNPGHLPKNLNPSQERSIPEHQKRKVNIHAHVYCVVAMTISGFNYS